jgi:hypothetical protein
MSLYSLPASPRSLPRRRKNTFSFRFDHSPAFSGRRPAPQSALGRPMLSRCCMRDISQDGSWGWGAVWKCRPQPATSSLNVCHPVLLMWRTTTDVNQQRAAVHKLIRVRSAALMVEGEGVTEHRAASTLRQ